MKKKLKQTNTKEIWNYYTRKKREEKKISREIFFKLKKTEKYTLCNIYNII